MGKVEEKTEETEEIKNLAEELEVTRINMVRGIKAGANWFFVIAILYGLNIVLQLLGKNKNILIGFGTTRAINQILFEGIGRFIYLLDAVLALVFVFFTIFARKRHFWSFLAGMILYALDAVLLLLFKDVLSFAVHLVILFFIFKGVRSLIVFDKINQKGYFQPHEV